MLKNEYACIKNLTIDKFRVYKNTPMSDILLKCGHITHLMTIICMF